MAKAGISPDYQPAVRSSTGGFATVSFPGTEHISVALKERDYREAYRQLLLRRAYTVAMPDNALVQIMYRFKGSDVVGHRLAFFAAPDLEKFQNAPAWYSPEQSFVDVQARVTAPLVFRFDYDAHEARHQAVDHPKSHMTLGLYSGCRIPVSAPLSPDRFMDFVLRNFYDNEKMSYFGRLPRISSGFEESIDDRERRVMHMTVPG